MKNAKEYSVVLKSLIQSTEVKMLFVARSLGYDLSYISKWCGGHNLPPQKNIEDINKKLGELFAKEYINKERIPLIKEVFEVELKEPVKPRTVERFVYKQLNNAYEFSRLNANSDNSRAVNETKFTIGHQEVLQHFTTVLKEVIDTATNDIELLCTVDLCNLLKQLKWANFPKFNLNDITANMRFSVDIEGVKEDAYENIRHIYRFLNNNINCNIWLYNHGAFIKQNVAVIKDKVAFIFSLDKSGNFILASETWDEQVVNQIYDLTYGAFENENIIINPDSSGKLTSKGYRTKFYSAQEFHFFNAFGFEYLLPAEIVDDIAKAAVVYSGKADLEYDIKRLQTIWEEKFDNGKITFVIPKSNILKYIERGRIYYLDIPFTVPVQQRRKHVRHIVACMKKNPNLKIVVFDDDDMNYTDGDFNISLYYNAHKSYMKRNGDIFDTNDYDLYSVVLDTWLLEYLQDFFNEFCQGPLCRSYSAEEIEHLINEYEEMFLRILRLK